jgi:hypothetical protein
VGDKPVVYRLRVAVRKGADKPIFDLYLGKGAGGTFSEEKTGLTNWLFSPTVDIPAKLEVKFAVSQSSEEQAAGGFLVDDVSLVPTVAGDGKTKR